MAFRPRPDHPYAHAPLFPEGQVDVRELFEQRSGPIEIEIGPGRGGFVFERCAARADVRILGLEIRLKWASVVDERLRASGLSSRARVLNADARDALSRLGPDGAVSAFFLHFPDPWWKKRHTKRLVVGPPLLEAMVRLLQPGGDLFLQTDVEDRLELYRGQHDEHPALESAGDLPGSARLAENPYGARSPREHRAIADGLPVHRLRYRRRG